MTISMKKMAVMLFAILTAVSVPLYAQFAGGSGSSTDPYQIETPGHLNAVRNYLNNLNVHFIMLNDIDLSAACAPGGDYYNAGQGWIPIGSSTSSAFRGGFNGNEHIINGLYINRFENYQGLFGFTYTASISNLGIENVDIIGSINCGGLVASTHSSGSITNCYVSGNVNGTNHIGGLVGHLDGGSNNIINCHSTGNVNGEGGGSYTGGLVGRNDGYIENSYSSANVTGGVQNVGGLVGYNDSGGARIVGCSSSGSVTVNSNTDCVGGLVGFSRGSIENSHSTSNVSGGEYNVGGLVGQLNGSILNCYCTGSVIGGTRVGGLVGYTVANSTTNNSYCLGSVSSNGNYVGGFAGQVVTNSNISNSYSRSNVIRTGGSNSDFGGFLGYISGTSTVENCMSIGSVKDNSGENIEGKGFAGGSGSNMIGNYFDMTASGHTSAVGASGRNTAELTYPYATYAYTNWNFTDIWVADTENSHNNGYPYLFWQTTGGIPIPQVSTAPVTGITTSSAISGGDVSNDGGNAVTAKGIAWCSASSIFSGISPEFISAYPLSSEAINGSNNVSNQLTPGTIVLYKTKENRFGKFMVESIGWYLALKWVTFNSDGSVFTSGDNLVIHASYYADMDLGQQVSVSDQADFQWSLQNETIRFLYPENGALFGVYHLAGDNLSIYVNEGYTTDGDGTGSFTSGIPGLSEETAYYVRAYAMNSAGIAYGTPLKFITASSESNIINLTVFLEGLYDPGSQYMRKAMAENGPRFPWEVADQITISLAESYAPYNVIAGSGLINLNSDGNCTAYFPVSVSGDYYLIVNHRNSIESWSSSPVSVGTTPVSYNFSDEISKAFGNNTILKGEKYCIYGADVDQNGSVDTADMTPIDNDSAVFASGYNLSDVNGDGITDTADLTIADNNTANFIMVVQP